MKRITQPAAIFTASTFLASIFAVLLFTAPLRAQDTRALPSAITNPPICATYTATKTVITTNTNKEPSSETSDVTGTGGIQALLNTCPSGEAVDVVTGSGTAVVLTPLTIPGYTETGNPDGSKTIHPGISLIIDTGVTAFASINPTDYDPTPGTRTCGTLEPSTTTSAGCNDLITVDNYYGNPAVDGVDGKPLGIFGPGTIDGRGNDVLTGILVDTNYATDISNDPSEINMDSPGGDYASWWDLAADAIGLTAAAKTAGLTLGLTPAEIALHETTEYVRYVPRLINFEEGSGFIGTYWTWSTTPAPGAGTLSNNNASNFIVYDLTMLNAPLNHIGIKNCIGCYVWAVSINSPWSTHNTDGIDIANSQNVTVYKSHVNDGDDNVAINAFDAGGKYVMTTSGISVIINHFFAGHGTSIGSTTAGVSNVLVDSNSYLGQYLGSDGSTAQDTIGAAINFKTRAGIYQPISNVQYSNLCIENVATPIQFQPYYEGADTDPAPNPGGALSNIEIANVHVIGPSPERVDFQGYNSNGFLASGNTPYELGIPTAPLTLSNLVFDSLSSTAVNAYTKTETIDDVVVKTYTYQNANIRLGPGPVTDNGGGTSGNLLVAAIEAANTLSGGGATPTGIPYVGVVTAAGYPNTAGAYTCTDTTTSFNTLAANSWIFWRVPASATVGTNVPSATTATYGGGITYSTYASDGTAITTNATTLTTSGLAAGTYKLVATYTPHADPLPAPESYATMTAVRVVTFTP